VWLTGDVASARLVQIHRDGVELGLKLLVRNAPRHLLDHIGQEEIAKAFGTRGKVATCSTPVVDLIEKGLEATGHWVCKRDLARARGDGTRRHDGCHFSRMPIKAEKRPIRETVFEESRRLREQSLRIRDGLGIVIHRLFAERIAARRAIRATFDLLPRPTSRGESHGEP
jgi:hypothetical protein